jgi:hypothetical protein
VFRWSNPEVGDVYGNVFVWTPKQPLADGAARSRDESTFRSQQSAGRPLVVGSLFHWFSSGPVVGGKPSTMEHELISLAEEPIAAKFHGQEVWATREAGVKFADVPKASAPAASEAQRNAQLRQLAKEFTGMGVFRTSPGNLQLRLLPQPIYRYSAAEDGVLTGGLFAFVRATDPEILLLIEARGTEGGARWQFAAVRSHSMAELWLEHDGQRVWQAEPLAVQETFEKHNRPYTAFKFREIPEFLKGTGDR